jgi:hypothetical protein
LTTVAHTVVREAAGVDVARLFDVVVAEDVLPKVLHRWGPIPGVRGTAGLTGPWDTPGSSRTVLLEDGSTARETLLQWKRPSAFAYRVEAMTNPLGRLVDHAHGTWEFTATPGGSRFAWTYAFTPTGRIAAPLIRAFVAIAWARYLQGCADRSVALARRDGETH